MAPDASGFKAATAVNSTLVAGQAVRSMLLAQVFYPDAFDILDTTNVGFEVAAYADVSAGIHSERVAADSRSGGDLERPRRDIVDADGARIITRARPSGGVGVAGASAYAIGQPYSGLPLVFLAVSVLLMELSMACRG